MPLTHTTSDKNDLTSLIADQKTFHLDSFLLESGIELPHVTIAYKTWGRLNARRDNCLVICHALSGSSDVEDWWGPLLGTGRAFDPSRYLVFCANVLGSPYGTTSPLSGDPRRGVGERYGPAFPQTTVRDDVRLHKLVLDALGVSSVAAVVGGSMGGMAALEWPLCTPEGYVKNIIPIATAVDHDAWGIAWAEAQRQCVFADPVFNDGYYTRQPTAGLAAARMVAMLTYRSSISFSSRFGRNVDEAVKDGKGEVQQRDDQSDSGISTGEAATERGETMISWPRFKAQSYLQYHGQKFVNRFDANCFIHLTRKLDTHDLTRGRSGTLCDILRRAPEKALVIGVRSDVLFRPEQQEVIAESLPDARLVMIESGEGHDGFLLEFEKLGSLIRDHLMERCPWVYEGPAMKVEEKRQCVEDSVFGEVESGW